MEFITN